MADPSLRLVNSLTCRKLQMVQIAAAATDYRQIAAVGGPICPIDLVDYFPRRTSSERNPCNVPFSTKA